MARCNSGLEVSSMRTCERDTVLDEDPCHPEIALSGALYRSFAGVCPNAHHSQGENIQFCREVLMVS
jgi:hypothetical protein